VKIAAFLILGLATINPVASGAATLEQRAAAIEAAVVNPVEAQDHAARSKEAQQLAREFLQRGARAQAALILRQSGVLAMMAEDHSRAVPLLQQSAELCRALKDHACLGRSLNNIGVALQITQGLIESLVYLRRAAAAFVTAGEAELAATARFNAANIQLTLDDPVSALATYQAIERDYVPSSLALGVLTNKAAALAELGRMADAQRVAEHALRLAQSPTERAGYLADMRVVNLGTLAQVAARRGDVSKTDGYIRRAEFLASELSDRDRLVAASACLEALDELERLARSRGCAESAAKLFALEEEVAQARILHLAAKAFAALGDTAQALDLHQRAYLAVSNQRRTELARTTATAVAEVGLAERNSLVGELQDEIDTGRAARERMRLIFALLAGAAVTAGVAFFAWSRANQSRRRNETVRLERQRVARELHDTATQSVAALALRLQLAERETADDKLKHSLSALAREARLSLAQVRDAVWHMRSEAEINGDLRLALSAWLDSRRDNTAEIQVEFSDLPQKIDPEVAAAVLRVVQESVTNAQIHGNASAISVAIAAEHDLLQARIKDDGIGFSFSELNLQVGRYGLLGMRERIAALGGELAIESEPQKGTTIIAQVPAKKYFPKKVENHLIRLVDSLRSALRLKSH
jgi:signal transduction histidine kinase